MKTLFHAAPAVQFAPRVLAQALEERCECWLNFYHLPGHNLCDDPPKADRAANGTILKSC